eukprot:GFYU01002208.1.p1 GENE.GFYU01002208.1~~GFYU01002208.1.p1  ORF type:complete len:396 (-),score=141.49 GFYU01002208.1:311-1468(-)
MGDEVPPDAAWRQDLAQLKFDYSIAPENEKAGLKAKILEVVKEKQMLPFYNYLCDTFKWTKDSALESELLKSNEEESKTLEEKITDAKENLGENEVREAMLAKAEYLHRIGEKEVAITAYDAAFEKTVGHGQKMDIMFAKLQIAFVFSDLSLVGTNIEEAKVLSDKGGDWERKNRLKVYEATYLIAKRDFSAGAKLYLESIATFTTYELFTYNRFIFYAIVSGILSLDRVTLKQKIIDAPEILTVLHEIPHMSKFINSLYNSDYRGFFEALVEVAELVRKDRFLNAHVRYFCREIRVVAYKQFLESYKSVTIDSMAKTFGVSTDYLDSELFQLISSGRLSAKIDKVSGVVETNRADHKNGQYLNTIKQGDLLLNRIQKLSRVINM